MLQEQQAGAPNKPATWLQQRIRVLCCRWLWAYDGIRWADSGFRDGMQVGFGVEPRVSFLFWGPIMAAAQDGGDQQFSACEPQGCVPSKPATWLQESIRDLCLRWLWDVLGALKWTGGSFLSVRLWFCKLLDGVQVGFGVESKLQVPCSWFFPTGYPWPKSSQRRLGQNPQVL